MDDSTYIYEVSRVVKFVQTRSRMAVARGWREEGMGSCLMGIELMGTGEDGKVWRWMVVIVAQQCECTYARKLYT